MAELAMLGVTECANVIGQRALCQTGVLYRLLMFHFFWFLQPVCEIFTLMNDMFPDSSLSCKGCDEEL